MTIVGRLRGELTGSRDSTTMALRSDTDRFAPADRSRSAIGSPAFRDLGRGSSAWAEYTDRRRGRVGGDRIMTTVRAPSCAACRIWRFPAERAGMRGQRCAPWARMLLSERVSRVSRRIARAGRASAGQAREKVLDQARARGDPGLGQLARELGGGGDQLRAAGRLDGTAQRVGRGLDPCLGARSIAGVQTDGARRLLAGRLAGVAAGLAAALRRPPVRRAVEALIGSAACAECAASGASGARVAAVAPLGLAARAAARRALARWGRVRGRAASTPDPVARGAGRGGHCCPWESLVHAR